MRPFCAITMIGALFVGFMESPFYHVHEQRSGGDHHAEEAAHVHVRHSLGESSGPAVQSTDPSDDERVITWFQSTEQSAFLFYVAPEIARRPEPVVRIGVVRPAPSFCNHDPPFNPALPSRAPPVASV